MSDRPPYDHEDEPAVPAVRRRPGPRFAPSGDDDRTDLEDRSEDDDEQDLDDAYGDEDDEWDDDWEGDHHDPDYVDAAPRVLPGPAGAHGRGRGRRCCWSWRRRGRLLGLRPDRPAAATPARSSTIEIPEGATSDDIGQLLADEGIITSASSGAGTSASTAGARSRPASYELRRRTAPWATSSTS